MPTYSEEHNATILETLIYTLEFQERFNSVQKVFQRYFTAVSFDLAPKMIMTQTDEDNIELVIEVQADGQGFSLNLVFEGDRGYAPDGSGEHFPSSKLKFLLAYSDTGHDSVFEDGWSGGGEYYDKDGELSEAPVYYQKLERIIPEICQIFLGYVLHPELAMNKQQYQQLRGKR
jgi:hypothetical protein